MDSSKGKRETGRYDEDLSRPSTLFLMARVESVLFHWMRVWGVFHLWPFVWVWLPPPPPPQAAAASVLHKHHHHQSSWWRVVSRRRPRSRRESIRKSKDNSGGTNGMREGNLNCCYWVSLSPSSTTTRQKSRVRRKWDLREGVRSIWFVCLSCFTCEEKRRRLTVWVCEK